MDILWSTDEKDAVFVDKITGFSILRDDESNNYKVYAHTVTHTTIVYENSAFKNCKLFVENTAKYV